MSNEWVEAEEEMAEEYAAPRKPFVRLTDEEIMIIVDQEIMTIVRADGEFDEMMLDRAAVRFVRAIENALAEKSG